MKNVRTSLASPGARTGPGGVRRSGHGPRGARPGRRPPHGVVVRVEATGLCRSDWHAWAGHDRSIALPHVPGHELAGTVAAVGADVTRLGGRRPGHGAVRLRLRHLPVLPGRPPPGLRPADPARLHRLGVVRRAGRPRPRRRQPGRAARRPRRPRPRPRSAAGSPRRTAPSSTRAGCAPGDWVAVHGCGGVGLSAVMIAVAAGRSGGRRRRDPGSARARGQLRRRPSWWTPDRRRGPGRPGRHGRRRRRVAGRARQPRRPPPPRCAAWPSAAGTCRSACCRPTSAGDARDADGAGSSPTSWRSSAATGWPRTTTRRCWRWWRPAGCAPTCW